MTSKYSRKPPVFRYWYTTVSASSNPTYTLDLGSCVYISQVTLWFGAQAYTSTEFTIQGSPDCTDYSDPGQTYGPGNTNQVGSSLLVTAMVLLGFGA